MAELRLRFIKKGEETDGVAEEVYIVRIKKMAA